ncbi:uncharacterized protein LOC123548073 [Mercenaria mercenaria]|uniref:uncharacterized protein LOC123548073 n=1 Tax=Mercenaria mercenaria TaxID=6596 RepID=UPI00234E5017|nr:uncharacterized protein LOC123548073 [Mercenaria mercenaria]
MRSLLFVCIFVCVWYTATGYCRSHVIHKEFCTAPNGVTIPAGGELLLQDKCEKCTCSSGTSHTSLILSCCGYGIHAGPIAPPPGCKIVADDDGCSVKLVQVTDESQSCHI